MIKKLITFFIIICLFVGYPVATVSAASKSATKTVIKKTTIQKKVLTQRKIVKNKKIVKKKKERLILQPALFTLETAPHSPKPSFKKKIVNKNKNSVLVKKKN